MVLTIYLYQRYQNSVVSKCLLKFHSLFPIRGFFNMCRQTPIIRKEVEHPPIPSLPGDILWTRRITWRFLRTAQVKQYLDDSCVAGEESSDQRTNAFTVRLVDNLPIIGGFGSWQDVGDRLGMSGKHHVHERGPAFMVGGFEYIRFAASCLNGEFVQNGAFQLPVSLDSECHDQRGFASGGDGADPGSGREGCETMVG
jgi:hypothetical protein